MENKEITMLTGADSETLAREIIKILDDRKAKDIKLLKVSDKTVMTDYFVICTGNSNTQIKGIAGELEYKLSERGVTPIHTDGYDSGKWIVLDYAHVIVHVFYGEDRDFYKLEKLWGDATEIPTQTDK